MSWISNFVRPKLRALVGKDVPENLWHKCPKCDQMLFHRDLDESLHVCRHCGYHLRISPEKRLDILFDQQNYHVITLTKPVHDPLKFKDLKRYSDRIKEARTASGHSDAIVVARGTIGGKPTVVAAFDFNFMGGSMGMAVGNGLLDAARMAVQTRSAFVVVPASGGARMQEGVLSLMQMARSTVAVEMVKEEGLPYIVLLTDPTAGGVTASFAMLGDITLAEPRATICFSGRRVIEQTIRQKLPDDFQTSEFLLEKGMIDEIVERKDLNKRLGLLLGHLMTKTIVKAS
jgi:acetyl-CoA carboxylase carboxyl transferase subunit beta